MTTATATADDKVFLVAFPRRNKVSGAEESLRVESTSFGGHWFLGLRTWFSARPNGPDDDGWRPTKAGVVVREDELDALADAVAEARRMVHAEGRATSPPNPADRKSRRDRPRHHPYRQPNPDEVTT